MARTHNTTAQASTKGRKRQPLDLSTAEQADGALPPIRSVYELVGIKDVRYNERTFTAYSARLNKMDLVELHDHAYDLALTCSPSRSFMIQKLEEKYLKEHPDQREAIYAARQAESVNQDSESIARQAERIMTMGR